MASLVELESRLQTYQSQIAQVNQHLSIDPSNEALKKLLSDLNEGLRLTQDFIAIRKTTSSESPSAVEQPITAISQQQQQQPQQQPQKHYQQQQKSTQQQAFAVGDYVQGLYNHQWYTAIIEDISQEESQQDQQPSSLKYHIRFVGYNTVSETTADKLRPWIAPPRGSLNPGTRCFAVYSGDGLFYEAVIDTATEEKTCWVTFTAYGNSEEVPLQHIRLMDEFSASSSSSSSSTTASKLSSSSSLSTAAAAAASSGFSATAHNASSSTVSEKQTDAASSTRKGQKRKSDLNKEARKEKRRLVEEERNAKQQTWQKFLVKTEKTRAKSFRSGTSARESIFKSPDSIEGRVGVSGSGKGMTDTQTFVPLAKATTRIMAEQQQQQQPTTAEDLS